MKPISPWSSQALRLRESARRETRAETTPTEPRDGGSGARTRTELRRLTEAIEQLPSIPIVAHRVGELAHDPQQDARSIAEVMKGDPALTAKVLRIVNSPYYAIPGGVTDVARAISFLGFSALQQLVLTVSVFDTLDVRSTRGRLLFRHCVAAAAASEAIAQIVGHPSPHECFTAGLLHDLGHLAILQVDHDEDPETHAVSQATHEMVGDKLATKWRFPVALRAAIGAHHCPTESGEQFAKPQRVLIDVTALADTISRRSGYGTHDEETPKLPTDVLHRLNLTHLVEERTHDRMRWNLERTEVLFRVLMGEG
ncbi:MAG: HDOD domain-containing protein [Sandaracinus sp.]|nr:HDOD domain-containing protein [Sandaracinus sp.]MCB9632491.1 HDOD domain-containing protein [Sandaracinus sp.]